LALAGRSCIIELMVTEEQHAAFRIQCDELRAGEGKSDHVVSAAPYRLLDGLAAGVRPHPAPAATPAR
jgi:hypothetical protein